MQNLTFIEDLRDRDWARTGLIALALLLVGVTAFALAQTSRLEAANARIDAVTQKAFYETCELTESMSVNLRKLLVAGETGQIQALLNDISLQAQGAMSNLALLPLGQDTVAATLKFINQAGDFAAALSVKLGDGGMISAEEYETIGTLSDTAAAFAASLAGLLDRYERGEAVFVSGDAAPDGVGLYPIANPAAEYPVLLYDGPFSDGRAEGEFKALAGLAPVSADQAREALNDFIGEERGADIRLTGEADIPVECYEFSVRLPGYALSAGVTKAGGRVLYLLCDSGVEAANLSRDEGVEAARAFLAARGFGDMEPSYMSRFGGILTVNLAPVEDGVALYPDLVKVQVSLRDGQVVGMEAAMWLMNHVPRALPTPVLTEQEALDRLGGGLAPVETRLCVIPQNGSEYLCYEIRAVAGSDTFLAYIDAVTGAERELMQIIPDGEGTFVM